MVGGVSSSWTLLLLAVTNRRHWTSLPRNIMLYRARGVEPVEEVAVLESDEGENSSEAGGDMNCQGDL